MQRRTRRWVAALIALTTVGWSLAQAQVPGGGRGPGARRGAQYMRQFNPATLQTVQGEVIRLDRVPHGGMGMEGVHAIVKLPGGELAVHLGPSWFIDHQEVQLEVTDSVTVTGSRVAIAGVDSLIATEVKRGADVLTLRDAQGVPVWVAWR